MWDHTDIQSPAHRQDTEAIASWVFDIHTHSMEYSAQLPVMYHLTGDAVTPQTIVGQIMNRIVPEDQPKIQEAMERAITARQYTDLIFRVTQPDGDLRYLRTINGHLKDQRYLFGTTIDVTERVEHFVASKQGAVLELAEKSLNIGFVVMDFIHQRQEVTEGIFRLLELDSNTSFRKTWSHFLSLLPAEDLEWCKHLSSIFSVPGMKNERILMVRLPSGSEKYIRIRFNTIVESNQRMILFEDITEEYKVNLELERNRMFLKLGGAAANVGGYVRNHVTGELSVTDQMISMLELESVDPILSEHILMRVHADDRPRVQACYEKTKNFEPVEPLEYRIVVGEGEIRWVRHLISYENNGRVISGTLLEITDEVERRASLETTNKEIEQLMYSVSHDLRAPVRHISSFAHLLSEEAGEILSGDHKEFLENILHASGKLAAMLDKLLEFSKNRHEALHKSWIRTNDLVESTIGLFKTETLERQISWSVEELPDLYGHGEMIERVFQNLISNAVKFTSNTPLPVIRINGREDGSRVIITIQDNGAGFDMEYADKLFALFERLHNPEDFEGTGFGLASVQQIIRRHGGDIWAEGQENAGASFHFSLPLS